MGNGKDIGIANFVVKYNSDPTLVTGSNHESDVVYLLDTDQMEFNDIDKAIEFLMECTNPITRIEELVPELKSTPNYKYILPRSRITPKHVLYGSVDCVCEGDIMR